MLHNELVCSDNAARGASLLPSLWGSLAVTISVAGTAACCVVAINIPQLLSPLFGDAWLTQLSQRSKFAFEVAGPGAQAAERNLQWFCSLIH